MTTMIRVSKQHAQNLKEVCQRHPLKPSLRKATERAIELMIEDLEVEITNANQ